MLRILSILIFLTTTIGTLFAQESWRFVPDPTSFLQAEIMLGAMDQAQQNRYYEYRVEGDTIVQEKNYQLVFSRKFNGSVAEPFERIGYLRKDTTEKVFFVAETEVPFFEISNNYAYGHFNIGEEVMLFDFNVEIGDTIEFSVGNKIVHDIDSITLVNGTIAKRIIFGYWTGDYQFAHSYWVEGLGGYNGLLGAQIPRLSGAGPRHYSGCIFFGPSKELVYSFELNEGFPLFPSSFSCNGSLVSTDPPIFSEEDIQIFPNPSHGPINITIPATAEKGLIRVIDLSGIVKVTRLIDSHDRKNEATITVNLTKGLYFVVYTDSHQNLVKKIVIQ